MVFWQAIADTDCTMIQTTKPVKAFVYIIESPKDDDLLYERTEGKVLTEALKLFGILSTYSLTCSGRMFREALTSRLIQACHANQCFPVLHFSMHGNHQGICLTSNDFISWEELRQLLIPLNTEMQGGLLICFSSCFGAYSCLMEYNNQKESAFGTIVGHRDEVSWSNSAAAYICFYNRLFQGASIEDCIQAMKAATGDNNFHHFHTQHLKEAYLVEVMNRIKSRHSNHPIRFLSDIY